jgi:hypothetical protein
VKPLKPIPAAELRKCVRQLLTSACVIAVAAGVAWGGTVNETSVSDFSNTFAGANLLPGGTTQVIGMLNPDLHDVDYFKFAGLQPGSSYLFTESFTGVALYGVLDSSENLLNGLVSFSDPMGGTVPADGILVVIGIATSNFASYTIDLSATQASAATPEPATLVVTGLALAALALRRKLKK